MTAAETASETTSPPVDRWAAEHAVSRQSLAKARRLLPQAAQLAAECEASLGRASRVFAQAAASSGPPRSNVEPAPALQVEGQNSTIHQPTAARLEIVTSGEPDYPPDLHHVDLPPPALFVRGQLPSGPSVAIVGPRRPSRYGRAVAESFAADLGAAGVTIVSGFALGIDQIAHRACLRAGGQTIAVLGCGLDQDYPFGCQELARAIAESGALVTEFPLGTPPRPWRFPVRNRIIAALSQVTLVIEASERSGSLSTARRALDLGRDVFAVPGRITDPLARGTNTLLRDGAHVALCPDDILEVLGVLRPKLSAAGSGAPVTPGAVPSGVDPELWRTLVEQEESTAESLASALRRSVESILTALLGLELDGWVERSAGGIYRIQLHRDR